MRGRNSAGTEMQAQAEMECRPKPKWNAVVPPILKKHHAKIAPLGISLVAFVSSIGRMNGRYGVES